jgi:hypothetical protein
LPFPLALAWAKSLILEICTKRPIPQSSNDNTNNPERRFVELEFEVDVEVEAGWC